MVVLVVVFMILATPAVVAVLHFLRVSECAAVSGRQQSLHIVRNAMKLCAAQNRDALPGDAGDLDKDLNTTSAVIYH